jgi:hypothetical protein
MTPQRRPCDIEEWRRRRLRELAASRESRALSCPSATRKATRRRARDRCAEVRRRRRG